jgi:hypothetical protein
VSNAISTAQLQRYRFDSSRASDLEITSNWLENAASINANDGSPKSEFVREATKSAGEQIGKPISDADFQKGSNDLAREVLTDIADKGNIPTASEITTSTPSENRAVHPAKIFQP